MKRTLLWLALLMVTGGSFAVLLGQARVVEDQKPPLPARVVDTRGTLLFDGEEIMRGQNVWQSLGGQQIGSIWGHGAYVAPDWTADYLHRESELVLEQLNKSMEGSSLTPEREAGLRERLRRVMRTNRYDASSSTLVLDDSRVLALAKLEQHYARIFGEGHAPYAIPAHALDNQDELRAMVRFFFWTAWAAVTERPGSHESYTMNFPHEPLVGNVAPPQTVPWSMFSVVLLLFGVALLVAHHVRTPSAESEQVPERDPFSLRASTRSQRATYKYFVVAGLLMLLQVLMGAITAHYGVEGQGFYGLDLARVLPYAVTRTWHTQLGIFWIATAWLGTGLWLAPLVGHEPSHQRLGVNALFGALVLVVLGALGGTWASVQRRLGGELWYWFGHQGWEYVDLGRVFQIGLFVGLLLWLTLMLRALWPALMRRDERRPLLVLFVISTLAIALFYAAGFMYGRTTHLSTVEHWRWWVVHLWVEGFFEVFATVAIAYLFVELGLLQVQRATDAVLFATTVFLGGGILGTLHHTYFSGTPASVMALGATFSALEIVPLTLVGFEVFQHLSMLERKPWLRRYEWPVKFFVAVACWNMLGAGVFGFLINPPIALYYMQGLNLTPLHGHTALFGVYGMLGIGLALFCLQVLHPGTLSDRVCKLAFWTLNLGLLSMALMSLLPIGVLQTVAAVERGTWWARSEEFMQLPIMQTLRWLRAPGDTVFSVGALLIVWLLMRPLFGGRSRPVDTEAAQGVPAE
jgi:nitric oxide reductase subunit B